MSDKVGSIEILVQKAMAEGSSLSATQIEQLRLNSQKVISALKIVFWVALGSFNVLIWLPFSSLLPDSLRWLLGIGLLLAAFVIPIVGIRRHGAVLSQLENCTQGPKRSKVNAVGRSYMDSVKKQGRVFIRAEFSVLEGKTTVD